MNDRKRTASTASLDSIPEIISRRDTSLSSDPEVPVENIEDHDLKFNENARSVTPPAHQKKYDEYVKLLPKQKPHINTTGWNPESRYAVEKMKDRKAYMEPGIKIYNKAAEENNGEKMEKKEKYDFTDIAILHAGLDIYYSGLEIVQPSETKKIQKRLVKKRKFAGRKTNKRKALKKKVKKTKRKSLKKRRKTKRRKN
jgi:hypothetical protein